MNRGIPQIVPACPGDVDTVAALVATAFEPLPAVQWLMPDADRDRARSVLTAQFAIVIDHAVGYGHVDLLADRSGAAVWLHADRPVPLPADYGLRLAAACGPYTGRFAQLDTLFARHQPHQPHHHLAFLAVAPQWQRTGRGSRLLAHHHHVLDRAGLPAHLHASSSGSRRLYLRHHYTIDTEWTLPPHGPPFWSMCRPPRMASEPGS